MKATMTWTTILTLHLLAAGGCAHSGANGGRDAGLWTRSDEGTRGQVSFVFGPSRRGSDEPIEGRCKRPEMPLMASLDAIPLPLPAVDSSRRAEAEPMDAFVDIEVSWRPDRPELAAFGEGPGVVATLRAGGGREQADSFTIYAGEREHLRVDITAAERTTLAAGCEAFLLQLEATERIRGELDVRWTAGVESGDRARMATPTSYVFR